MKQFMCTHLFHSDENKTLLTSFEQQLIAELK